MTDNPFLSTVKISLSKIPYPMPDTLRFFKFLKCLRRELKRSFDRLVDLKEKQLDYLPSDRNLELIV